MTEATAIDKPQPQFPQVPPGMQLIPNCSLEDFERAVYSHDHEKAGQMMLHSLRVMKMGGKFIGYPDDERVQKMLYTRFCAAVIALLADPTFNVSQDGLDYFASEHAIMDLMFRASAFRTSDHLLAQLADKPDEPSKMKVSNGAALMKFLMTWSLRSVMDFKIDMVFGRSPQMSFSLWAGMLSPLLTISVKAQQRREELLGMHAMFADVRPSEAILPTLSDAYMYASYGVRRDKHDMKATIHAMFARLLVESGVPLPNQAELLARRGRGGRNGKPVMVICLEWFSSNHAMYRCYAPIIRQLRSKFYLIGLCSAPAIDDIGKSVFDEWQVVPHENVVLGQIVQQINELAPDVIYYPSLGMALWWVALASVRLAPIQCMTLGHPSSSRSPAMDYVLCDEGAIGDPALFNEKIITYPNGSARYVMRPDAMLPEVPAVDPSPQTVHIAVPAMLCKLNADFMRAMQAIDQGARAAGRDVQFHFFINMMGVNLIQSAREIRDWVPTAKSYERRHYNQYMQELAACHLHLCTFPFGGTNSNIDSMLMGLPLVALEGDQPHERFDAMMIRRAGLPESLVAKSVEEYVAAAVALIVDHNQRNALRQHLLTFDLDAEFFGDPPEGQRTAFVDAMWRMYEGHQA